MKRKISKYITDFFDELNKSKKKRNTYSEELVNFDKGALFEKITYDIELKENNLAATPFYKKSWLFAAACTGILFLGYFSYSLFVNKLNTSNIVWKSKITIADKIDSITLEDGTKVWLNVNSSVTYPERFNTKFREIKLDGEAYFEVKHDVHKPFVIHSGNINTTVLGTSFDINAYQNSTVINVTVRSGKVKVADSINRRDAYFITPKQQISFHKKHQLFSVKKDVNLLTSIGWQKNKLIFEDRALKDVIPLLNRKFDKEISIDSSLDYFEITANFEHESLDNILRVLSIITNGKIVKQKDIIFLKSE